MLKNYKPQYRNDGEDFEKLFLSTVNDINIFYMLKLYIINVPLYTEQIIIRLF